MSDTQAEYHCPNCDCSTFSLKIVQEAVVHFEDDGDHTIREQPFGDIEWDEDTAATCSECGHDSQLGKMKRGTDGQAD